MITFSYWNSNNFNGNFKDNFMLEILVALILSFASSFFFHHLYVWERSQIAFDDFFLIASGYIISFWCSF